MMATKATKRKKVRELHILEEKLKGMSAPLQKQISELRGWLADNLDTNEAVDIGLPDKQFVNIEKEQVELPDNDTLYKELGKKRFVEIAKVPIGAVRKQLGEGWMTENCEFDYVEVVQWQPKKKNGK